MDQSQVERFKSLLNPSDFEAFKKQLVINTDFFVPCGAISGLGNSLNPWKNNVTLFRDCPFYLDVEARIKNLDPDITVEYTNGWSDKPKEMDMCIC